MPRLTRQRTLESVLSWWSDSNAPGATINLHAAAKPLMKLMYHRQALDFMKRNNAVPLTPETLEIYLSYLSWKYVSTSTKLTILVELATRAGSKEDVLVLIHSDTIYTIIQLLQSASYDIHSKLIGPSAAILRNVASHSKSTNAAVIELLVALLRDSDVNDIGFAFELLSNIALYSLEGAEGVVAANALHYLLDGLGSPSSSVRWGACELTDALARHESTAAAVIELHPCNKLAGLSGATDTREAVFASDALIAIANWPDGAAAVVGAHVLDHVLKWFASPLYGLHRSACRLLEKLAQQKSTAGAVMDPKLCGQLVIQLYTDDDLNLALALDALASIANWPDGAQAVVAAKALDHLTKSLVSRWADMREAACRLLAALMRHESSAQAVARAIPRERLVALLRDEYKYVHDSADNALQALDSYLVTAQAPTDDAGESKAL
ncbi:armadillo-type protein [Mycena latifolia]|nr:armadillo-type protein [Mycena latifolia]